MVPQQNRIYVATTVDTKGAEAHYIRDLIVECGAAVVTVDLSTQPVQGWHADISAETVADHHPDGRDAVMCGDRGQAINAMALAFERFMLSRDDVAALLGIGGSGGTALITPAMQALPIGVAKLMISTMASGNVAAYIGASDIAMLHSVTDVAGLNRISRQVLANGAHMMVGAVLFAKPLTASHKPVLGLTMFGVTTPCIQQVTHALEANYDCLVFHATGNSGRAMEKLLDSHLLDGVLDLTTTEVCDYLFHGTQACGEDRLASVARSRVPYVGAPGALDMVNFGHIDSVPACYAERLLYKHNAQITLMRTTVEENRLLGQWLGEKLNLCPGPVRFLLPEKGVSALDAEGQPFDDPVAREALFQMLESTVKQTADRRVIRVPCHINDPRFADVAVSTFREIHDHQKVLP